MFQNSGGMQDFGGDFGGGGFQVGGFGSPAVGDRQKKIRSQNIVPVTAQNVSEMIPDDSAFRLGDNDVSHVTLVGTVIHSEKSQTCTTYKIDDTTGTVIVKHWNSLDSEDDGMEGEESPVYEQGSTVRVFAQVRSFQKIVTLNALHIRPVEDLNEITVHMLECIKFNMVSKAKKNQKPSFPNQSSNAGFSQFSSGGGFAGNQMNQSSAMNMGMNAVQTQVWQLIEGSTDPGGMSITEIRSTLKGLNLNRIKEALDFLSNEGHIYSTVDDEHFKSTS
ncbi:unnamed protein product [Clavelina lepadiformis]|uniref:Replication protein A C-terminal domain-containing protein n=1 Tax=Clavelina lepadiformis TaxID=159417 RepID=A0ABP0GHV9_CLALP